VKAELVLEYWRVGHRYDGKIKLIDIEGTAQLVTLVGATFGEMMRSYVRELSTRLEVTAVVVQRGTDGVDHAYVLTDEATAAMRRDPATAIASMLYEPEEPVSVPPVKKLAHVRTGEDTLADAFGESMYCAYKSGKFESPFSGRWEDLDTLDSRMGAVSFVLSGHWLILRTSQLLGTAQSRYWSPREWNPEGWISHADLQKKYDEYTKEVANVYTK
jgi:hypothetical protein